MTDMTDFERQVASEMVRRAGPVRPVDDLAVYNTITTATQSPRWRFWSTSRPTAKGDPTTITGRTYAMFTPVKAIVAGALTFALLGVLSIAQPFDQQGATVPGAPVASPSPSAPVAPRASPALPSATRVTGTELVRDDPRVSGTGAIVGNWDGYGDVGTQWGTYRLENANGAWEGTWRGVIWNRGGGTEHTMWLTGSGAYEGLTYYAHVNSSLDVEGIIFPGEAPAP
jgi:hypothetical protein